MDYDSIKVTPQPVRAVLEGDIAVAWRRFLMREPIQPKNAVELAVKEFLTKRGYLT